VDPLAGLDDMEKRKFFFYPTGTRTPTPLGRPARSQSLYRLSYPGSTTQVSSFLKLNIAVAWDLIPYSVVDCYRLHGVTSHRFENLRSSK
jgi:hypothetical protein